eukprot:2182383-Pyramimonas_sp.AAC.1
MQSSVVYARYLSAVVIRLPSPTPSSTPEMRNNLGYTAATLREPLRRTTTAYSRPAAPLLPVHDADTEKRTFKTLSSQASCHSEVRYSILPPIIYGRRMSLSSPSLLHASGRIRNHPVARFFH